MAIKIKKNGFWIDTGIELDEELNKSNQAADAAITGNLITDLKERTNELVFGDSNAIDINETIERLSTEIQPIERGGTSSNDGAQGLNNLLLEGQTVLSNHQYGESFPNLENPKSYTLFLKNKSKGIEDIPNNTIFEFLNKAYPIGSIYITAKTDNPSVLFGGTWERIKDRILIGFGDTYTESTENVSKLNVVDSGHTIPGAITVNMWKRTGMFELPDLTVAIYDDSFPLQWNSLEITEIKNARNSSGMIKISNLIPTVEKMKNAFIDVNGETFIYSSHFGTERDYSTVYEYVSETNKFFVQVVKEGYDNLNSTLEPGIYVEDIFKKYGIDKDCQLGILNVYDDTLPIQWNSIQVANANNIINGDYVKISNLTLMAEEMESIIISFAQGNETIELPYSHTSEGSYLYTNESATAVVELRMLSDGLYAGNYGSTDWNGEIWDVDFTASITIPTAIYNGVELPDINTVWTDKETYPYAVIVSHPNGDYSLVLQSFEAYVCSHDNGGVTLMTGKSDGLLYAYRGGEQWVSNGDMDYNLTLTYGETGEVHGTQHWASYDIKYAEDSTTLNYYNNDGEVRFTAPIYPTHSDAPYIYISNYTILGSKHLTLYAMPAPIYKYNTILYNTTIYGCQESDLGSSFKWYCYTYNYNNAEERAQGWVKNTSKKLTYYAGDSGWGDVSSGPMYCTGSDGPAWANHDIIAYADGSVYFSKRPEPTP